MEMIIKRLLYHYRLLSLIIVTQRTATPTTTSSTTAFLTLKKLYICRLSRSNHCTHNFSPYHLFPLSLSFSLYFCLGFFLRRRQAFQACYHTWLSGVVYSLSDKL